MTQDTDWLGTAADAAEAAALGAAKGAALGSVVPGIGTAVGAGVGGLVALASKLTSAPVPAAAAPALAAAAQAITGQADEQEQVAALTADPRGALTEFQAQAQEVVEQERTKRLAAAVQGQVDALRTQLADVANARDHADPVKPWLAVVIIALFALCLAMLMLRAVPQDAVQLVNIALGALIAAFGTVVQFYFGSSSGSAFKTALLARGRK